MQDIHIQVARFQIDGYTLSEVLTKITSSETQSNDSMQALRYKNAKKHHGRSSNSKMNFKSRDGIKGT